MVNVADLAITSLDTITAYSLTGVPRFILDELQDAKIANTQEKSDITGKQGRKLSSLKKNKGVVVSGTSGLLSAGLLEAQIGSKFEKKEATPVAYVDYLTVNSNKAITSYKAIGTAGAEIDALYVINDNNVADKKLTQVTTTVDADKFTYAADTKTLAFKEGELADGTRIAVFYSYNVAGYVLSNMSDKYSEKLRLYIDGTAEDKCNTAYRIQFRFYKADFEGNFDLDMGGDQTVHAFEAESLPGGCGENGALWDYTIFGITENEAA